MLLLAKQPLHGYELRRQVEETSGRALSNNSLYPALRRFTEADAVARTAEPQQGRPPPHIYTITDVGRELLHDMLADLPEELAGDSSEFLARLGNFGWLDARERLQILDARAAAVPRQLHRLLELAALKEETWPQLVLDEVCHRPRSAQN